MSAPPQRQMLSASGDAQLALEKRMQERAQYLDRMQAIEARREEAKQTSKTRHDKRKVGEVVIEEYERDENGDLIKTRRAARKFVTTLDQLEKRQQLGKHLRDSFDKLANAVSLSSGACIDDRDLRSSTNRGIASWESQGDVAFGSKSLSDQILEAETLRKRLMDAIPVEMMKLASMLLFEETGQVLNEPLRLAEFGELNGFNNDLQGRASGATMAIDVCRVIHHALKGR